MKLANALQWMNDRRTDELVITPAGSGTRAWYEVSHDVENSFYLNASMGMVSMFGAGLAMNAPGAFVWALSGDGGVLMNPGAFLTEAEFLLPNLKHVIIWNKVFHASGRVRLGNSGKVDFARVAEGFGVPAERCFTLSTEADLDTHAEAFSKEFGYALIVLQIELDLASGGMGSKPHVDGPELKYLFGRARERALGVRIFDHQGM
jgi:thiamine pyrophosphate-dependent acetolactate synthase large subunit-like protein